MPGFVLRTVKLLRRLLFCLHGLHRPFPVILEGWTWDLCVDCGKRTSGPTRIPWTLTVIPPPNMFDR